MYICIFGRDPNDVCWKSVIFITVLCFIVRSQSSKFMNVCAREKTRFPFCLSSALETVEKTGSRIFVISIFFKIFFFMFTIIILFYNSSSDHLCICGGERRKKVK